MLVPKKIDNSQKVKWRLVVDFRRLNNITKTESYPLPLIDEILGNLGKNKYFSTIDLYSGFFQIEMEEKSKGYTGFTANGEKYEFSRMPMGLKNSPSTFQKVMNNVLTGLTGLSCLVYLDDVVVMGENLQKHNENLRKTLTRLRENGLKIQTDKCNFLRKECIFLGHKISEDGIFPDERKLEAVKNYPTPKTQKDIKSFLGLMGYYRKFIKDFAKIASPLNRLLKKDELFVWTQEQENSFRKLIKCLLSADILIYPDFEKEFILTTDASNVGIGAVLSQITEKGDSPIAFASRALNKAEKNYSTIEKELLGIIWGTKQFRQFLFGKKFKVVTDHKPLVYLKNITDPGSRLVHWQEHLEGLEFEVIYKKGILNGNADALSRMFLTTVVSDEEKLEIIKECHSSIMAGHRGCEPTYNRIIENGYIWQGLRKQVTDFVKSCKSCQLNKSYGKTKIPMVITDTPTEPMDKVALDIVGKLPKSIKGHEYLLTFQDVFSKYTVAIPLKNIDSETVADKFVKHIISKLGLMKVVLTDQGSNFTSALFKNICKIFGLKKIQTSAYHPESNGSLERYHRPLKDYFKHFINKDQSNWHELAHLACLSYNSTVQESTGFTPNQLMFGRNVELPSSLKGNHKPFYAYDDYVQRMKHNMTMTNNIAQENLVKSKEKNKEIYDRKTTDKEYKAGEQVLLH